MELQVIERRAEARFLVPPQLDLRVTLRPGCSVELVEVCAGGALIEVPRPLRPGGRVHVQVTTPQRTFAIAANVTRCMVWSLDPLEGARYRGALRFDHRIKWCWGEPHRLGEPSDDPRRRR
ncbi:MAG: hypothetical protein ABIS06_09845 [Vicinamibacterales bacterium]